MCVDVFDDGEWVFESVDGTKPLKPHGDRPTDRHRRNQERCMLDGNDLKVIKLNAYRW